MLKQNFKTAAAGSAWLLQNNRAAFFVADSTRHVQDAQMAKCEGLKGVGGFLRITFHVLCSSIRSQAIGEIVLPQQVGQISRIDLQNIRGALFDPIGANQRVKENLFFEKIKHVTQTKLGRGFGSFCRD